MAKRLTDKDKKRILADYAETENYRETARNFGIDDRTVRKICKESTETTKLVEQKKKKIQQICCYLWILENIRHRIL